MTFNHKDERILKLWAKNLPVQTIARKIGMPTEAGIQRVYDALKRNGHKI